MTDDNKASFIQSLTDLLNEDGMILIGDVAFATRADLMRCQCEAVFGHSTSQITELYYVKKDTARLNGIMNGFEI